MPLNRQQVLDLYFMDARAKLIDIAAFLDRVDRAEGEADFRLAAFRQALKELDSGNAERAKNVLLSLSDPSIEPLEKASVKGAIGAFAGNVKS
ncbi:MAG TPA: hypothetical protein VGH19_05230 [Verrucomicrobiae bacterium]